MDNKNRHKEEKRGKAHNLGGCLYSITKNYDTCIKFGERGKGTIYMYIIIMCACVCVCVRVYIY